MARLALLLVAAAGATMPAGATGTRHHQATYRHRHIVAAGGPIAPVFAPPAPVEAGPLGLSGPQIPGLPGGGGVLGTGLSGGEGLLGIGFFGL